MKKNLNLQNLSSYDVEILDKNIKRCHSNEAHSSILSIEILTKNVFEDLNFYPEKIYKDLESEASKFYKIKEKYIIPVNGSDEGLDLIIRTFCNKNDNILLLDPTFSMYSQYAKAFGLNILITNLNENFTLNTEDVDDIISFCQTMKVKMLFIPNPIAPSGNIILRENLIEIIENLPETFIVIDEAYIEFSNEESLINLILKYKNLIVTRTLSKFFGLAGIRLGFIFTSFKDDILKIKSPYNVNKISCQIGINLFKNITEKDIKKRFNENLENKEKMLKWLQEFKEVKKIYLSFTNFLFVELIGNSKEFSNKLLKKYKIKIKTFSSKFKNFCRISF